jgi:putative transposase
MKWINVSYAVYLNRKRRRSGHLFQGRFKVVPIDADETKKGYRGWDRDRPRILLVQLARIHFFNTCLSHITMMRWFLINTIAP